MGIIFAENTGATDVGADADVESKTNVNESIASKPMSDECKSTLDERTELHRLKLVLKQHINANHTEDDIDIAVVLDDFLFLLNEYSANDDAFEYIHNALGGVCDFAECAPFGRNYRARSQPATTCNIKGSRDRLFVRHILDKIHCYFSHSYDLRYRLRSGGLKPSASTDSNKATQLTQQSERNNIVSQIVTAMTNKFNQMCYQMQYAQDMQASNKFLPYSLGCQFKYGYKGEVLNEHGVEIMDMSNKAKYQSLKEEVMNKDIVGYMNVSQFDDEYGKAMVHCNCQYRLKTYPDLCVDQILALMIYCNYDDLQRELSKTYRNVHVDESETSQPKHVDFWHWAKLLKRAVHESGTASYDAKGKKFYHGSSEQLTLPSILGILGGGIQTFAPLSTSASKQVAAIFASNNGIIMELTSGLIGFSRFFECSWLSDYPGENEHFFIQNASGCLQVNNIIEVSTGSEFESILVAIKIMDELFGSVSFRDRIRTLLIDHEIQQLMKTIVLHRISQPFQTLHAYAKSIVHTWCEKKTEVNIDWKRLVQPQYSFLLDVLLTGNRTQVPLENILLLFPNARELTMNYIVFSSSTWIYFIGFLRLKSDALKWKYIRLKPAENSKLTAAESISKFKAMFEKVGFDMYESMGELMLNHDSYPVKDFLIEK